MFSTVQVHTGTSDVHKQLNIWRSDSYAPHSNYRHFAALITLIIYLSMLICSLPILWHPSCVEQAMQKGVQLSVIKRFKIYFTVCTLSVMQILTVFVRVSDPHWFNADPDTDPDPAFLLIADPDSGSGSRVWWPKIEKNYSWKKIKFFFWLKTKIYLSQGLHKGRPSYRRSLQPSKENIQHFKTWKFYTFSIFVGHFCPPGSGSGSAIWMRIRIRIQQLKLMRIRIRIRIRNPGFCLLWKGSFNIIFFYFFSVSDYVRLFLYFHSVSCLVVPDSFSYSLVYKL